MSLGQLFHSGSWKGTSFVEAKLKTQKVCSMAF